MRIRGISRQEKIPASLFLFLKGLVISGGLCDSKMGKLS